ncbi:mechanosensitive ion channel [Sulfurimonas gotlandica GD1]|jgi:small conductance mechanosensitive channel|uniref:Mechanosensitive ion channel n=1 Tax=Sulfurimonas gotlandica (strain DSM 19862 / JCM 16533 / GD1) TaxID=929558 RepID=H1FRV3_SULGG|nr:mechanosensitive ion channel [Sulfurimonas gotlandica GD1]
MEMSKYTDMALLYVSQYGLKIIAAILIFIIGRWAVKKITALSKDLMLKAKVDNTFVEFLESIVYFVLMIVVILASLNTLGINTTSFLAIFGAAGLAIGLALKDSLSNIGAAVLIIIFRPFKVGDTIEAAGTIGTVKDINLFSTILEPIDKSIVIVPNSSIINGNITNFSQRTQRRVEHVFSIGYDDDLKLAKETLMQIILSDERVLSEPAPLVAVSELGDSSVNFVFRAWVNVDDYWDVHFDMLEKVKLTFDEKGISIPYPQMDIHTNKIEG